MSEFSVERFRTEVGSKGFARQNRFVVQLHNVDFSFELSEQNLILLCQSASIPGVTVAVKKQTLFGPDYIRPASINYGDTLSMTFLCDKDMKVKRLFDMWVHQAVNMSSFTVNYKYRYARDITISQIDEKEEITYSVKLIDAFPVQLGALSLNQSALDRFHMLPVTFAYRYWETNQITNSEIYEPFVQGPIEKTKPWGPKVPLAPLDGVQGAVDARNIGEVGSAGAGRSTNAGGRLSDFGLG